VNETMTSSAPRPTGTGRRHRRALALVGVVVVLAAVACTKPPGGDPPPPPPPTGPCRLIDFQRAEVKPAPSPAGTVVYVLTVSGVKPSVSQTVRLVPVTYIQQPDYWRIEVQACDPPEVGLPATGPFEVSLPITGSMGKKGIEVAGATRTQRFDLASDTPAPKPGPVGSWHVTGVSGGFTGVTIPVVAGSTISLDIKADGSLSGRACNQYWASWTTDGSTIAISDVAATKMACPDNGVGDQENRYFSALRAAVSWKVERTTLSLIDSRGLVVVTADRGHGPAEA
jgi:heat shock protein HslJ